MNSSSLQANLARLLLPFAAGYFLSYLYRTVNAVIGPALAREMALPDNALGLLTSTYFLAFGLAQLPVGLLLDRYGPRRVEGSLLFIASLGVAMFGLADSLLGLAIGRGLIGLGVAACLMAALKAFSYWYPADRLASLTGWVMASGGLGALVAAQPLEFALGHFSWRTICLLLALVTVLVALYIWWRVPDPEGSSHPVGLGEQLAGLRGIFGSRHFWRYGPMGFCFTGGFMAIQGLWASRWMAVMEQLSPAEIAARLTWMSGSMLAGFFFLAFMATPLVRRGLGLDRLYLASMLMALAVFALLCEAPQLAGDWLWPLLGICFSLSNTAYTLVASAYPKSLSGRASTALNLLVFAGAFGLQWGIGLQVDALQALGWSSQAAFQAAFRLVLGCQLLAMICLLFGRRRSA